MPEYEYRCVRCKFHLKSVQRSMVDTAAGIICRRCGGRMGRVFHPVNLGEGIGEPSIFRDPIAAGYREEWKNY